jgi:hypothetical protein
MKKFFLPYLAVAMSLISVPAFSQAKEDTTALLNLPGDNLDLYAVLDLFQKSKTIEAFEKSLNDEKTGINNLDLNLDKKIDFIKVVTTKKDSSYTFVLQVDVTKTETQDVAVIFLNKDKGKISLQMVGDEELYGKDYVIEPKGNSSITANPGYTGSDPVTVNVAPAPATTVVVQSAPIVQYVYSPAYVPYYPPYYYGFYPPYFAFATCIAVGIYRANNWGYHGGYYGGHYGGHNNVVINTGNRNQVNHYNNSRNTSNTVSNNMAKGNYGNRTNNSVNNNRGNSTRPSTSNNMSNNRGSSSNNRPSTSNNMSSGRSSSNNRPSTSNNMSSSNRASSSNRSSSSNFSSSGASRSRSSSGFSGGGGGMRGGGGGGRRR